MKCTASRTGQSDQNVIPKRSQGNKGELQLSMDLTGTAMDGIKETSEEMQPETQQTKPEENGNPWLYRSEIYSFKHRKGDSVIMQCNLCLPRLTNVTAYKNSALNLGKHIKVRWLLPC